MTSPPFELETERLWLRAPRAADAPAIFERYASDVEVVRYLSWPRHADVAASRAFVAWSEAEWARGPAGPLLAFARDDGALLGSTGLAFEAPTRAATGYVLARDAWGRGLATEMLAEMVAWAAREGVERLHAFCHPDHRASARVLEKGGFALEARLRAHTEFPNLSPGVASDVLCYVAAPAS